MWRQKFLKMISILCLASALQAQDVLEKVVAIVDDNIILRSEVQQFAYSLAIQSGLDPSKSPDKFNKILEQTLDNLITQKALLVKAKEDSVTVSDQQIDSVLEEQIQQMVRQLGSEDRVEEYFGSPLRQIRREFRSEVEERLLVQKLQESKNFETQISRKEVEAFYKTFRDSLPVVKDGVRISHILVSVEASDTAIEAVKVKAEEVLRRLRKGEDFAELAKQFSEDPGSSANGGDLGLVQPGDMVKPFEEAAFALSPGETSELVQTQYGLHIIQQSKKVGEKIRARHILFRVDTSPDDEKATVAKLAALRERIVTGELTFAEAVKQNSKDVATVDTGGDLGFFDLEEFQVPAFKEAVTDLDAGGISPPIKTKFGHHIIRLDERRDERKLEITKDWEQIEGWALNMKRTQEFQKYVTAIKKEVYIEIKAL